MEAFLLDFILHTHIYIYLNSDAVFANISPDVTDNLLGAESHRQYSATYSAFIALRRILEIPARFCEYQHSERGCCVRRAKVQMTRAISITSGVRIQ